MAKRRMKETVAEKEAATKAAEEAKQAEEKTAAAAKAAEEAKQAEEKAAAAKAAEEAKQAEEKAAAAKAAEEAKQAEEEAAAKAAEEPTLKVEDILKKASEDKDLKSLAGSLNRYIDAVFVKHPNDGTMVANMNHELFVTINNVLSIKDYNTFKKQFDFINKLFIVGAKDKFSPIALSRYDHQWSHGTEQRHKYVQLIEVISALANPNTRNKQAKRFSLDTLTSIMPKDGVQNVVRYYNL